MSIAFQLVKPRYWAVTWSLPVQFLRRSTSDSSAHFDSCLLTSVFSTSSLHLALSGDLEVDSAAAAAFAATARQCCLDGTTQRESESDDQVNQFVNLKVQWRVPAHDRKKKVKE